MRKKVEDETICIIGSSHFSRPSRAVDCWTKCFLCHSTVEILKKENSIKKIDSMMWCCWTWVGGGCSFLWLDGGSDSCKSDKILFIRWYFAIRAFSSADTWTFRGGRVVIVFNTVLFRNKKISKPFQMWEETGSKERGNRIKIFRKNIYKNVRHVEYWGVGGVFSSSSTSSCCCFIGGMGIQENLDTHRHT